MLDINVEEIPQIDVGSNIEITLHDIDQESIQLYSLSDSTLSRNGMQLNHPDDLNVISIVFSDAKTHFKLPPNTVSIDSNSLLENNTVIRGFSLFIYSNKTDYNFIFLLRSKASAD